MLEILIVDWDKNLLNDLDFNLKIFVYFWSYTGCSIMIYYLM